MIDRSFLAAELHKIAKEAALAIMAIYEQPALWQTQQKQDLSPVTTADLAAHQVIAQRLQELAPRLPLLSEEGAEIPWQTRQTWQRYWLVDPLDGTKEFLERNDEFTVNIALIEEGRAVFGVIYQPVTRCCYLGGPGWGAFKISSEGQQQRLQTRSLVWPQMAILTSHRHGLEKLEQFKASLENQALQLKTIPLGSSLKFCYLAEGLADVYPRLGPTGEWDTAAAQAILEAAGGQILDWKLRPLTYNQKPELTNPDFLAIADPEAAWSDWLSL